MNSETDYDVLIVGAGVSGALVANDLARRGKKVLVLEAGPELRHPEAQVPTFYAAAEKTPGSPWPPEPEALRPSVLDMGIKSTFQNDESYMRQTGNIPFNSTYERIGGGTTNHWLGTALRHVPNDFKLKSEYDHGAVGPDGKPLLEHARDWPITYEEIEPWYTQAEYEVGVSGDSEAFKNYLGAFRSKDYPMPEIDLSYLDQRLGSTLDGQEVNGEAIKVMSTPQARNSVEYPDDPDNPENKRYRCLGNTSCIPICPIQAKYDATVSIRKALQANAIFQYKTIAYKVDVDEDDQISGIRCVDYSNADAPQFTRITAKVYVLSAHAIETAKLLLMSKWKDDAKGKRIAVANSSDQVGRNLMDHIIHLSWGLAEEQLYPFRGPLSTTGIGEFRDSSKRSERAAYRIEIGNDGWSWPDVAPLKTVDQIINRTSPVIEAFFEENPGIKRNWYGPYLRNAVNAIVTRQIRMAAEPEALPLPESRVTVSDQIDDDAANGDNLETAFRAAFESVKPEDRDDFKNKGLGIPKPLVDYAVSEYTKRGSTEGKDTLAKVFEMLGVKHIETRIIGASAAAIYTVTDSEAPAFSFSQSEPGPVIAELDQNSTPDEQDKQKPIPPAVREAFEAQGVPLAPDGTAYYATAYYEIKSKRWWIPIPQEDGVDPDSVYVIVLNGSSQFDVYRGIRYEYGGAGHIAGTYVMGNDAADSVVDKNCRSHDHQNLFLLGSGVFPALGTANPTLTIMALALRAAETIAGDLS